MYDRIYASTGKRGLEDIAEHGCLIGGWKGIIITHTGLDLRRANKQ